MKRTSTTVPSIFVCMCTYVGNLAADHGETARRAVQADRRELCDRPGLQGHRGRAHQRTPHPHPQEQVRGATHAHCLPRKHLQRLQDQRNDGHPI